MFAGEIIVAYLNADVKNHEAKQSSQGKESEMHEETVCYLLFLYMGVSEKLCMISPRQRRFRGETEITHSGNVADASLVEFFSADSPTHSKFLNFRENVSHENDWCLL